MSRRGVTPITILLLFAIIGALVIEIGGIWYYITRSTAPSSPRSQIQTPATTQITQPTTTQVVEPQPSTTQPVSLGEATTSGGISPAMKSEKHWESVFSFPYPVSLQKGWNGAAISLAKAALDAYPSDRTLTLHFDIQTGYGGFCTVSFANYGLRRVTDELGNLVAPRAIAVSDTSNCANGNSTLFNQKIFFDNIPSSNKEIIIGVFGQNGQQQTYFTVSALDNGTIRVEPAPTQG